jgi:hypothetical protein
VFLQTVSISTQAFRALLMEDEAVAFIAGMVERIVNADVGKEELTSLSTLLLVLIPKADGGARPVAMHSQHNSTSLENQSPSMVRQ